MCEQCKEESDDDYEGNSIAEKRQKAVASIVERHPELGLEPDDVKFRFTPKHKWPCVRVNLNTDSPRYEIHVQEAMGPMMRGGPSLSAIAQAAFIETNKSYQETCNILGINPVNQYKALFLAEEPPMNPVRVDSHGARHQYDSKVTEKHEEEN